MNGFCSGESTYSHNEIGQGIEVGHGPPGAHFWPIRLVKNAEYPHRFACAEQNLSANKHTRWAKVINPSIVQQPGLFDDASLASPLLRLVVCCCSHGARVELSVAVANTELALPKMGNLAHHFLHLLAYPLDNKQKVSRVVKTCATWVDDQLSIKVRTRGITDRQERIKNEVLSCSDPGQ